MNRKSKIILIVSAIVISLTVIVLSSFVFLCKVSVKCKNCDETSTSEIESKTNHFFLGYYNYDVSNFDLKYNDEHIEIKKIWIEKVWKYNTENCFSKDYNSKEIANDGFNIIVDFKKSTDEFLFNFKPVINNIEDHSNGGIEDNRKTLRYRNLPKEIKLIVVERNPEKNVGWTQEKISDTITLKLPSENFILK